MVYRRFVARGLPYLEAETIKTRGVKDLSSLCALLMYSSALVSAPASSDVEAAGADADAAAAVWEGVPGADGVDAGAAPVDAAEGRRAVRAVAVVGRDMRSRRDAFTREAA